MSEKDEIKKIYEAEPNIDVMKLRRYLKSEHGFDNDDLNTINTADEVLNYNSEMQQKQRERSGRLKSGIGLHKESNAVNPAIARQDRLDRERVDQYRKRTPEDKRSKVDRISELLMKGK